MPSKPETLFHIIRSRGGLDPSSVRRLFGLEEIRENGLLGVVRNGGVSIDDMAKTLEEEGHFTTPPNRNSDDYLAELLREGAYSIQSSASHYEREAEKEYERYLAEAHEASIAGGDIEGSRSRGYEAGAGSQDEEESNGGYGDLSEEEWHQYSDADLSFNPEEWSAKSGYDAGLQNMLARKGDPADRMREFAPRFAKLKTLLEPGQGAATSTSGQSPATAAGEEAPAAETEAPSPPPAKIIPTAPSPPADRTPTKRYKGSISSPMGRKHAEVPPAAESPPAKSFAEEQREWMAKQMAPVNASLDELKAGKTAPTETAAPKPPGLRSTFASAWGDLKKRWRGEEIPLSHGWTAANPESPQAAAPPSDPFVAEQAAKLREDAANVSPEDRQNEEKGSSGGGGTDWMKVLFGRHHFDIERGQVRTYAPGTSRLWGGKSKAPAGARAAEATATSSTEKADEGSAPSSSQQSGGSSGTDPKDLAEIVAILTRIEALLTASKPDPSTSGTVMPGFKTKAFTK